MSIIADGYNNNEGKDFFVKSSERDENVSFEVSHRFMFRENSRV